MRAIGPERVVTLTRVTVTPDVQMTFSVASSASRVRVAAGFWHQQGCWRPDGVGGRGGSGTATG